MTLAVDDAVLDGDTLTLGVALALGVPTALALEEGVPVDVSLGLTDWDGVRVGVRPEVTLCEGEDVGDGLKDGVSVDERDADCVTLRVAPWLEVAEGLPVDAPLGLGDAVGTCDALEVGLTLDVGAWVGDDPTLRV